MVSIQFFKPILRFYFASILTSIQAASLNYLLLGYVTIPCLHTTAIFDGTDWKRIEGGKAAVQLYQHTLIKSVCVFEKHNGMRM